MNKERKEYISNLIKKLLSEYGNNILLYLIREHLSKKKDFREKVNNLYRKGIIILDLHQLILIGYEILTEKELNSFLKDIDLLQKNLLEYKWKLIEEYYAKDYVISMKQEYTFIYNFIAGKSDLRIIDKLIDPNNKDVLNLLNVKFKNEILNNISFIDDISRDNMFMFLDFSLSTLINIMGMEWVNAVLVWSFA